MHRPAPTARAARDAALLLLFFASGFVALLYQVIWQRLLGLVTGLDLYAVTLIVAVFMLGMGAGSFAGGALAGRMPPSRLLLVFAGAEAVAAAFAMASPWLYHDLLYGLAVRGEAPPALLTLGGAATLLVPTFCMGVTLPVLSQATSRTLAAAPGRIAQLYGWNTVGAAAGAWVGSAWVIRSLGYERSLWLGAAINLGAAVWAVWLARGVTAIMPPVPRGEDGLSPALRPPDGVAPLGHPLPVGEPPGAGRSAATWPWRTWVGLYFVSGFIALGLELVWFRLLGVVLKSTAFTFPLLLGFYLLGVGGGSLVGLRLARRVAHPHRWVLLAQAAVGVYASLSVALAAWALRTRLAFEPLRNYLASYEPIDFAFNLLDLSAGQAALYVLGPALLILPPTVLMGVTFSLLQHATQRSLREVGRRVAALQTANILGSTLGTIVVGIVAIDRFGTSGTLRALAAASGAFLVLAALDWTAGAATWRRAVVGAFAVLAAAGCALAIPAPAPFWGAMHGVPPTRIIHAEDGTGLAVLTSRNASFRSRTDVYVNGLGQSWIPFGGNHSFLGLVPVLLHPSPSRIAIIGLGSGDTVYSAAGRPETRVVECVEIIGGQLETLRRLYERTRYPGVGELLQDPRIRFTVGDGRRLVMQSEAPFDVIEADALRPASAYAGTLYSREYFELLRSRLAPGGLAVTWAPTARIQHTFDSVFPHVAEVPPMLIGSNDPIAFDPEAIRTRAAAAATRTHYDRAGIDLSRHVDQFLATFRHRQQGTPRRDVPDAQLNTDLFPRDELKVP